MKLLVAIAALLTAAPSIPQERFDPSLYKHDEAAIALCRAIQGARIAYIQSDEISVLVHTYDTFETQPWFGLNLQKMFGFTYNTDLSLSVWNVNNAKSQNYTAFANAVFDENKPGRSYNVTLRTSF